ncbi:hypothetical protein PINS_up006646 [Pythium insidiosum]|nr:hypothetical protein PINS_up006646 [Pythium insidiosum]
MITRLVSNAVPSPIAENWLTELTCCGWDWGEMRGATIAELLRAIGGVDFLHLQRKNSPNYVSAVPIDELPDLVRGCQSLRCLEAHVVCETPVMIPQKWDNPVPRVHVSSLDVDLPLDQPVEATSLERLCLRPVDRDVVVVQRSIERLLQRVGRSLVSLSLAPHRGCVKLTGEMANAVVRLCPKLQELKVTSLDVSFIEVLVNSLSKATDNECQLKRLDLGSHDADAAMFAPLFAALRISTHPLTRSLCSFRLDVAGSVDIERVVSTARDVLATNRRLSRLIISADGDNARYVQQQLESERDWSLSTDSLQLPPLRHRLAVLSAMRSLQFPREVLLRVFELVSHRPPRLSVIGNSELMYRPDDSDEGQY